MKKILATVSAVVLSLAMVAMPSVAMADEAESTETVTTETVTSETETTETETTETETTGPETTEPETTEPETTEAETTEPETTEPEIARSQSRAVASSKPEDTGPPEDLLCTDITVGLGYEAKVDISANDPVTVSIPAGFTLVAYCVKAGTEPIIIDDNDDAPNDGTLPFVGPGDFIIDHPNKDSVSHYQLLLVATQPIPATPDATFVDESCDVENDVLTQGVITVDLTVVGVTYSITQGGNPVAFDAVTGKTGPLTAGLEYIVTATADPGYELTDPSYAEKFTPTDDSEDCDVVEPLPATPDATFVDESCDVENDVLTQGVITVDLTVVGVTYSITQGGNPVAFDAVTGKTGPLTAGLEYIVTATADPGYELTDPSYEEKFTPFSKAIDCTTLALVTPQASQDPGCELPSFFIIGNSDSNSEALSWTANGEPIAEGKHVVTGPTTVHLVATGNGPEHGIEEGAQSEWTFSFPIDETCGELTTLALTGSSDTTPALALTAFLGLLGLAMVRSGIRVNRVRQEA